MHCFLAITIIIVFLFATLAQAQIDVLRTYVNDKSDSGYAKYTLLSTVNPPNTSYTIYTLKLNTIKWLTRNQMLLFIQFFEFDIKEIKNTRTHSLKPYLKQILLKIQQTGIYTWVANYFIILFKKAKFSSVYQWWHIMRVVVPVSYNKSRPIVYIIDSGSNNATNPTSGSFDAILPPIALATSSIVASISQVPNQPIIFEVNDFDE